MDISPWLPIIFGKIHCLVKKNKAFYKFRDLVLAKVLWASRKIHMQNKHIFRKETLLPSSLADQSNAISLTQRESSFPLSYLCWQVEHCGKFKFEHCD